MAGQGPLSFSCSCGQLQGTLSEAALHHGTRVDCFCPDCRAAELYFNQPDPAPGPVSLFQTTPDMVELTAGADKLGLMRLSPNGLFRWHSTCCNTPMFNTLTTPRIPFMGILTKQMDPERSLGKVQAQVHIPVRGKPAKHKGMGRMAMGIFRRALLSWTSGRAQKTPFFDPTTRKPVVEPTLVPKPEKGRLYPVGRG